MNMEQIKKIIILLELKERLMKIWNNGGNLGSYGNGQDIEDIQRTIDAEIDKIMESKKG